MDKKSYEHHNHKGGSGMAAGLGLAAIAAAAAGAIFLYGTDAGKKKRMQMQSWMLRMRADVIDQMAKMKDWSETSYKELIDEVAARYETVKNIDKEELQDLVEDMKKHWKNLKKQAEGSLKSSRKRIAKSRSEEEEKDEE